MKTPRMLCSVSALAALCVAGASTPVQAQNSAGTSGNQTLNSTALMTSLGSNSALGTSQRADFDRLFLTKAAMGNMAEVATSQMALQKSKNPRVQQIAQHMIAEHGRAQTELMAIMQTRGVPMPTTVGVMHQATADQLQRSKGDKFDQLYMGAQTEAHEATVSLYQAALPMVTDPATRSYIARYLPAIIGHTQMIYTVAREVNAPGAALRPATFPLASLSGMNANMTLTSASGGMNGGMGHTGNAMGSGGPGTNGTTGGMGMGAGAAGNTGGGTGGMNNTNQMGDGTGTGGNTGGATGGTTGADAAGNQ